MRAPLFFRPTLATNVDNTYAYRVSNVYVVWTEHKDDSYVLALSMMNCQPSSHVHHLKYASYEDMMVDHTRLMDMLEEKGSDE